MAPPPIFITVNLHSLLTLRTGSMQLGPGHPHPHAPPRRHAAPCPSVLCSPFPTGLPAPKSVDRVESLSSLGGCLSPGGSAMVEHRASAAERSENRREAVRPTSNQSARPCPVLAHLGFRSKCSF